MVTCSLCKCLAVGRELTIVAVAEYRVHACRCMLQGQVTAYVAWVNAQLKKKPGTRPVEDLKCDLQDGVALASLIEVVGQYSG